ncbi:hypothetical protein [Plantactinospora sp. BC1]|uniref:hypothetical protein n=1 Tax=Plantactinospora sp. BC1 TaxID=2108470 RepID=UPI00131F0084|nr:hypothetical protein [Plantactinospora sp. BC1]
MQEQLDVLQRVGHGPSDVRPSARLAQRDDDTILVESTVNPREMPEAGGGERLDLVIVMVEQGQVELLRLPPVAVAVQRASHHGVEGAREVSAIESVPDVGRPCRWRIVERTVLVRHAIPVVSARAVS